MPLYEYECRKCGRRFEKIQRFSDEPLTLCDDAECGGHIERLISPPAIQFKGSGWYITDYARKSTSHAESGGDGAKKSEKAAEKPSSSSSGESKPARSSSEKS